MTALSRSLGRSAELSRPFDAVGFILAGPGLGAFLAGAALAGMGLAPAWLVAGLMISGTALLFAYVRHAAGSVEPLIDLGLLRLSTFRNAVLGGTIFRVGIGAPPFLLPLMFQFGFGLSPLQSGMLTFAGGIGALAMKFMAQPLLAQFGFRRVLVANAVVSGLLMLAPAFFTRETPWLVMVGLLFAGGLSRSLEFTSVNAVPHADVPPLRLSSATSFSAVSQELSGSIGVTLAAFALQAIQQIFGGEMLATAHFPWVFVLLAALSMASCLVFSRLTPGAGAELIVRNSIGKSAAAPADVGPAPSRSCERQTTGFSETAK